MIKKLIGNVKNIWLRSAIDWTKFQTIKKTPLGVFLLVTTEGDEFDNQIKNSPKNSF